MERAAAMASLSTVLGLADLPEEVRGGAPSGISTVFSNHADSAIGQPIPDEGVSFNSAVTDLERDLLFQSLKKTGGNKMQAAKLLNMKRTTFVEKLKRLGITELEMTQDCPADR
jgi:DNA-binding NtrC family response regulator